MTIRLVRAGPKNDVEAVKIIAGSVGVCHFGGAACEAEGHGPNGATTSLVHQIVNLQHHELFHLLHISKRGSTSEREI